MGASICCGSPGRVGAARRKRRPARPARRCETAPLLHARSGHQPAQSQGRPVLRRGAADLRGRHAAAGGADGNAVADLRDGCHARSWHHRAAGGRGAALAGGRAPQHVRAPRAVAAARWHRDLAAAHDAALRSARAVCSTPPACAARLAKFDHGRPPEARRELLADGAGKLDRDLVLSRGRQVHIDQELRHPRQTRVSPPPADSAEWCRAGTPRRKGRR